MTNIMARINTQRSAPRHGVVFSEALSGVPRSIHLKLNSIRNGEVLKAPCAPCRFPDLHGSHYRKVHAVSLSAAVEAMKVACAEPTASAARQRQLSSVINRLCDRTQASYGARVILQLTTLGAVHAGLLHALQGAPHDAAIQRCEQDVRAAIIGIGCRAGAYKRGSASAWWNADSSRSRALCKAIHASDQVMLGCRRVMGDAGLFAAITSAVVSAGMADSLSERLPMAAECFRNGSADVTDVINMLQLQHTRSNEQRINAMLSSGEAVDFQAAVFELMKLPEFVRSAADATPDATATAAPPVERTTPHAAPVSVRNQGAPPSQAPSPPSEREQ